MARPSKASDAHRGRHLAVRLTPDELAILETRIRQSGLARSDYVRQAVLAGRVVVKTLTAADPALIAELNRIGVNLNQLTRTANGTGQIPPDLDRLCRKIEDVVMKAIEQEDADGADDHG
jgi:hypothetical protein